MGAELGAAFYNVIAEVLYLHAKCHFHPAPHGGAALPAPDRRRLGERFHSGIAAGLRHRCWRTSVRGLVKMRMRGVGNESSGNCKCADAAHRINLGRGRKSPVRRLLAPLRLGLAVPETTLRASMIERRPARCRSLARAAPVLEFRRVPSNACGDLVRRVKRQSCSHFDQVAKAYAIVPNRSSAVFLWRPSASLLYPPFPICADARHDHAGCLPNLQKVEASTPDRTLHSKIASLQFPRLSVDRHPIGGRHFRLPAVFGIRRPQMRGGAHVDHTNEND